MSSPALGKPIDYMIAGGFGPFHEVRATDGSRHTVVIADWNRQTATIENVATGARIEVKMWEFIHVGDKPVICVPEPRKAGGK